MKNGKVLEVCPKFSFLIFSDKISSINLCEVAL